MWKWFSFPFYIPTEWIEGWKEALILHSMVKKVRGERLFELLKESRNNG